MAHVQRFDHVGITVADRLGGCCRIVERDVETGDAAGAEALDLCG